MTDRPTPAERAADLTHDPKTCHICMNPSRYGELAPDPEELAHAREVDALRERLEDYRREVERLRVAMTNLVAAAEWLLDDCETADMRQYAVDALAAARIAKAGP